MITNSVIQGILSQFKEKLFLSANINGKYNKTTGTLYRFTTQENSDQTINFGHQHVSFFISEENKLLGFVDLTERNTHGIVNEKNSAKEIAMNFLKIYSSDLLNNMHIEWIDKHNEKIIVNNEEKIITGMKVKCRNLDDGLYFWVVVFANRVIIFERDVAWDFIRAGRQTEKWLHDDWLKNLNK